MENVNYIIVLKLPFIEYCKDKSNLKTKFSNSFRKSILELDLD